jgi:hypothetical protein
VLGEFAKYTEAITWNDSLLYLASFDSITVRAKLDSILESRKIPEDTSKKKRKRSSSTTSGGSQGSAFFNEESTATSDWYFGNPSAVALGQSEFQRIWGTRSLEDNWSRCHSI